MKDGRKVGGKKRDWKLGYRKLGEGKKK